MESQGSTAVVFERVADQILKQLAEMNLVHAQHRQGIADDYGVLFLDLLLECSEDLGQYGVPVHGRSGALGSVGRVRIGKQVLQQALHAVRRIYGSLYELIGLGIQLALVPLLQEFRVDRLVTQGLLQVMTGGVRELAQVAIGLRQLLGLLGEFLLGVLAVRDIGKSEHTAEQLAARTP